MANKKTIWKWFFRTAWVVAGVGVIVLLVAAVHKKESKACKGIDINIMADGDNFFVDQKDVRQSIKATLGTDPVGKPCGNIDLRLVEAGLRENVWIKSAELFFDNTDVLRVKIRERVPVARVFTTTGSTFYLDTAAARLPLSEKFSARVPVFTSFPSDRIVFSAADSSLLRDMVGISTAIVQDSFLLALIDQVDITPDRRFEMMPRMGNNTILFGDAKDVAEKFRKLKIFYRQVMPKAGWGYYSSINLQYRGQVLAKKRGAEEITADSLKVVLLMQDIARKAAEQQTTDTVQRFVQDNPANTADSSMIQESLQRDEGAGTTPERVVSSSAALPGAVVATPKPVTAPVVRTVSPPVNRPAAPAVRPAATRQAQPGRSATPKPPVKPPGPKPRVVMPPKNEYR